MEFDDQMICGADEVLFLEGRRKSLPLLVDALRDQANAILSKSADRDLKIITLREI